VSCPIVGEPVLGGHTETLSYAIDVVEIGNDLNTARNGRVVKALIPEPLDVCSIDRPRFGSDPLCELEQLSGRLIQASGPPADSEAIYGLLIVDLIPEVVKVRSYSVVALIRLRGDDGDHLPLGAGQRRRAIHDRLIETHRITHHFRKLALNRDDVPNSPGPTSCRVILAPSNS